jgi:peptidoglycan LD-endopeptidase LytH
MKTIKARTGRVSSARIAASLLVAATFWAAALAAVPGVGAGAWSLGLLTATMGETPAPAPRPTHLTYLDSLRLSAGGAEYLGWELASRRALEAAPTLRPPYAESGRFGGEADARGYRIELLAGERLIIELAVEPGTAAPFLDLLVTPDDPQAGPFLSRSGDTRLEYRARIDGAVVVRLQPRLGEAGGYDLMLDRVPALAFPVADDAAAIIGHFLEPRDGGARRHRGIDILAPLGTPVVAVADGVIERVEETERGGLVVWLRETGTNRSHYYAHLQTQQVRRGARVRAGEPVGTVGTTGNASETAPHLHFGVYRSGTPVNPVLFLDPPADASTDGEAEDGTDRTLVGGRARTRVAGAAFRTTNNGDEQPALTLPGQTPLEVLASAGRFYRVRLATGAEGFVAGWLLRRD